MSAQGHSHGLIPERSTCRDTAMSGASKTTAL